MGAKDEARRELGFSHRLPKCVMLEASGGKKPTNYDAWRAASFSLLQQLDIGHLKKTPWNQVARTRAPYDPVALMREAMKARGAEMDSEDDEDEVVDQVYFLDPLETDKKHQDVVKAGSIDDPTTYEVHETKDVRHRRVAAWGWLLESLTHHRALLKGLQTYDIRGLLQLIRATFLGSKTARHVDNYMALGRLKKAIGAPFSVISKEVMRLESEWASVTDPRYQVGTALRCLLIIGALEPDY